MRRLLLFVLVIVFALPLAALRPAALRAQEGRPTAAPPAQGKYLPGVVLVKFKPGAALQGRAALAAEGLEVTQEISALGVLSVAAPVGQEEATAEQLSRRKDVAYAEPDYEVSAQLMPNDPKYGDQWALTKIGAPQAWDVTTGAASVVIAVLDTGTALTHPDLARKLWRNTGEIPNNGKDDDGNGYADDVNGWHLFQAWNGSGYEPQANGQVFDDNGHGTHVAGIAAAATNNGEGVAGLSWQSPVMTVKVLNNDGRGSSSDIAKGMVYAADNGASVINLSLGTASASQVLCEAVSAAVAKGKLVVAAAGNRDQGGEVLYPAMCPGALAVGATDAADAPASFSISGSRVDLAAPGVSVWSTWYLAGLGQPGYRSQDGTSQAVPFVAGAAALVWARWPALSAAGVKAQLLGTVADVGVPGRDDGTGWGRLNVAAAVGAPVQPVDLQLGASVAPQTVVAGNPLTATFTITNVGAPSASSVTLSATLPAEPTIDSIQFAATSCQLHGTEMTCGVGRLDAGESVRISVVVTPTQVGAGELTTNASVSAAQRDLAPGDNAQTVKSAIRPALSGRVFKDGNGDGILQAWETLGIGGAWLLLEQDGLPVASRTSLGPYGAYLFDTLALGTYVLRGDLLPEGYQFTTPQEIALAIEPAQAKVVNFGAWDGTPVPDPTFTPTPSATPVLEHGLYLPVIVR